MGEIDGVLSRVHRDEWPRVVAALARRFGDLGVAEEMTAEAFLRAVERWSWCRSTSRTAPHGIRR